MSDARHPRHHRLARVWAVFQGGDMVDITVRLYTHLERWRPNQHYSAIARTTHA